MVKMSRDKFKLYLFEFKVFLSNINYVTAIFSNCTWQTQTEHLHVANTDFYLIILFNLSVPTLLSPVGETGNGCGSPSHL
jgi:hypothetical protein